MIHPELWQDIHSGERVTIRRQAIISLGKDKRVILDDGRELSADMLLRATGWHTQHSLSAPDEQLTVGAIAIRLPL